MDHKEQCEDCVSRQAVLASIKNLYPDMPILDIMGQDGNGQISMRHILSVKMKSSNYQLSIRKSQRYMYWSI